MPIDLDELRARYATLDNEQLLLIRADDLLPEARAYFEGELRKRGLSLDDSAQARADLNKEIQRGAERRIAGHRKVLD